MYNYNMYLSIISMASKKEKTDGLGYLVVLGTVDRACRILQVG